MFQNSYQAAYEKFQTSAGKAQALQQARWYQRLIDGFHDSHQATIVEYLETSAAMYDSNSTPMWTRETKLINQAVWEEILRRDKTVPIPNGYPYRTTPFDHYQSPAEKNQYEDGSQLFHPSVTFGQNQLVKNKFVAFCLLSLLSVLATGFAAEKGRTPSIQLMHTQPVSSGRIFLAKWSAQVIGLIGVIAVSAVISSIFFSVTSAVVEPDFPTIRYELVEQNNNDSTWLSLEHVERKSQISRSSEGESWAIFQFEDMAKQNRTMLGLLFGSGVLAISLGMLVSLVVENRWLASITAIGGLLLGYAVVQVSGNALSYLPFIYLDSYPLVDGTTSLWFRSRSLTPTNGYQVQLAWIIGLTLIGYFLYRLQTRRK